MTRWIPAALAAVLMAAPAAADDDSPAWRRLAAKAAAHNARTWVRLRDDGERHVWVDAKSAAGLTRLSGRPRTVIVLWLQDPETQIPHVGTGVAWTVSETTVHCGDRSATERRFHFGDDARLMAATDPVREEMASDDLLYDVVCKGLKARESVRRETALGVSNYEAAGQTDGPAAPQ